MEQYYKTSNNIDVYTYPLVHLHSFCISLYIKAGILYEGENENGITHFLEHIHFRNLNGISQQELYKHLDRIGANFNASTYKEFLHFYITAAPAHFNECAEILAQLLAPLTATEADVRAERKRVQSEIREGDYASSIENFSNQTVWEGTGLARIITGTITGVNQIDLAMLKAKKREIFTSDNLFFYVTGSFTEQNVEYLRGEIEKYPVARAGAIRTNTAARPARFQNRGAQIIAKGDDSMPSLQFTFDVEFAKYTIAEMDLLFDIMFTGEFSRFHMLLSEQNGLLYDYDVFLERYRNIGTLYLQYSVMKSKLIDAVRLTVQMFRSMKETVSKNDFTYILPRYLDNSRTSLDDAERLNWQMAYDNHIINAGYRDIEELSGMYRAVTPERLLEIANEIFETKNLVLAVKGEKRKRTIDRLSEALSELDR